MPSKSRKQKMRSGQRRPQVSTPARADQAKAAPTAQPAVARDTVATARPGATRSAAALPASTPSMNVGREVRRIGLFALVLMIALVALSIALR
jgi:hypothetical protein